LENPPKFKDGEFVNVDAYEDKYCINTIELKKLGNSFFWLYHLVNTKNYKTATRINEGRISKFVEQKPKKK